MNLRELAVLLKDPATRRLLVEGVGIINILKKNNRLTAEAVQAVVDGIEPLKKLAASQVHAREIMEGIDLLVRLLMKPGGLAALRHFAKSFVELIENPL